MNNYVEIVALVEGQTERTFMAELLTPYLAGMGVYLTPIIISKPGQKGGDVRFARVRNDIGLHLKQRPDTYLTLFVDYYGIGSDWPGLAEAGSQNTHRNKAATLNRATQNEVERLFGAYGVSQRFIPYVSMHEFEALLFSDPPILAQELGVARSAIDIILTSCGEPEAIDDSPQNAPSKRLEGISNRFKKTATGIAVARAIGLATMRAQCPLFDAWLTKVETLKGATRG